MNNKLFLILIIFGLEVVLSFKLDKQENNNFIFAKLVDNIQTTETTTTTKKEIKIFTPSIYYSFRSQQPVAPAPSFPYGAKPHQGGPYVYAKTDDKDNSGYPGHLPSINDNDVMHHDPFRPSHYGHPSHSLHPPGAAFPTPLPPPVPSFLPPSPYLPKPPTNV